MGILRELIVYPRLLTRVLPVVERELALWRDEARAIPDEDLRTQALSSLEKKKFHCVGGSVLALMAPRRKWLKPLVRAIVAIQTISDYLDNLCDRSLVADRVAMEEPGGAGVGPYPAFMELHESMLCAVDPDRSVPADYYRLYMRSLAVGGRDVGEAAGPGDGGYLDGVHSDAGHPDGGYLDRLVETSRLTLRELPGYSSAKPLVTKLVSLYSELQAGKHMPLSVRDGVMERWFLERAGDYGADCLGLRWWEFAAAAGSTLAVFALICASTDAALTPSAAMQLAGTYFPNICGLHILLDYYIDQAEDVGGGDLNFAACYPSYEDAVDALDRFTQRSMIGASSLDLNRGLHQAVVRGLLAMYLSDPKVEAQGFGRDASRLTRTAGGMAPYLRLSCTRIRRLAGF